MGTSTTPNLELSKGHWVVDGTGWSFQSIVYDTTSLQHKNIILDTANIQFFEYTNQWNSLVLTGQLVYRDTERNLGKLFRIPHLLVRVEWTENKAYKKIKKNADGDDTGDYWVEKPICKEDRFLHIFLVNKMELISHETDTDVTTYKLELVSASWYKLSAMCKYSNYAFKEPEPITKIICKLLIQAVGVDQVATKTFLQAPCKTDVSIYYTTTQNDNYFTAIHYLLNRMYIEPSSFDVENHPRIILWDEKESKYRLAKIDDDSTCLRAKHNQVQLNRFYEVNENEVNPYAPGVGGASDMKPKVTSLTKMSYTRFIKDYYTRHFWDLNITRDKFVRRILLNEKIQNTFRSTQACPSSRDSGFFPNPNITAKKDVPDLQSFLAEDKTLYLIDEAKWNNQRHIYNDCIQCITGRDSFILTRENKVNHQPWQVFYFIRRKKEMKEKGVLDTLKLKIKGFLNHDPGESEEEKTEKNQYADNQFFGPWYSYKTTHAIIINGTKKDSVPQMYERIQMVRPFEITPVPDVIKK